MCTSGFFFLFCPYTVCGRKVFCHFYRRSLLFMHLTLAAVSRSYYRVRKIYVSLREAFSATFLYCRAFDACFVQYYSTALRVMLPFGFRGPDGHAFFAVSEFTTDLRGSEKPDPRYPENTIIVNADSFRER